MTHAQLVEQAVAWLRGYRCGVVLSEQACVSGEMPDAIGWKRASHSVLVECKISRADFLADRDKPFRQKSGARTGLRTLLSHSAADCSDRKTCRPDGACWKCASGRSKWFAARPGTSALPTGLAYEMNLLLASLRRVEIRIEPQTITDFLKWKNRMQQYNGGAWPTGIEPTQEEQNYFLEGSNPEALEVDGGEV